MEIRLAGSVSLLCITLMSGASSLAFADGGPAQAIVTTPTPLLALNLDDGTDNLEPGAYQVAAGGRTIQDTPVSISSISQQDIFAAGATGVEGILKTLPTSYLGMQDKINPLLRQDDIYRPKDHANLYGGGINGGIRVTDFIQPLEFSSPDLIRQDTWIFAGFTSLNANFRSSSNGFSVNPTDNFIFAKPFGLPATYASVNPFSVTDLSYRNDVNTQFGYAKFAQTCIHRSYSLTGFGGVTYMDQTQRERFAFQIPTFSTDALYSTRLNAHTWSMELGTRLEVPLTSQLGQGFSVEGRAFGAYNFTTVKGIDTLDIFNGSSNFRAADLKRSNSGFGYGLGVGLNYSGWKNTTIGLGIDYVSQETFPRVVRDYSGVEQSRISFGEQDALMGTIGAKIKF